MFAAALGQGFVSCPQKSLFCIARYFDGDGWKPSSIEPYYPNLDTFLASYSGWSNRMSALSSSAAGILDRPWARSSEFSTATWTRTTTTTSMNRTTVTNTRTPFSLFSFSLSLPLVLPLSLLLSLPSRYILLFSEGGNYKDFETLKKTQPTHRTSASQRHGHLHLPARPMHRLYSVPRPAHPPPARPPDGLPSGFQPRDFHPKPHPLAQTQGHRRRDLLLLSWMLFLLRLLPLDYSSSPSSFPRLHHPSQQRTPDCRSAGPTGTGLFPSPPPEASCFAPQNPPDGRYCSCCHRF